LIHDLGEFVLSLTTMKPKPVARPFLAWGPRCKPSTQTILQSVSRRMTNQNSTETSQKPTDPPSLMLSKLEVASRQLETAIALYSQEADPVST
jgi:hypothetical protein